MHSETENNVKKAVQFGAGNIGRGFLGQLYSQSGYETVFVDVVPEIIAELNRRREYVIHIVDVHSYEVPVKNVRAVDGRDVKAVAKEILDADLMGTAVGVKALPAVASTIAAGLAERARRSDAPPINILICENLLDAGSFLKKEVLKHVDAHTETYIENSVGFVETVISRMVPVVTPEQRAQDVLYVAVEEYARLPVDRKAFVGEIPNILGMEPYDNLHAYEERKLFTHNCAHALCGYWGYQKGHKYVWQAATDAEIREKVLKGVWESGEALVKKHGFTHEQHEDHINDLLRRFANKALGDTVERIARDPIRKLGRRDRLVGSALLALEYGIEPRYLVQGIIAALRYDNPRDEAAMRLQEMLQRNGLDYILENVCGLSRDEKLYHMIKEAYV